MGDWGSASDSGGMPKSNWQSRPQILPRDPTMDQDVDNGSAPNYRNAAMDQEVDAVPRQSRTVAPQQPIQQAPVQAPQQAGLPGFGQLPIKTGKFKGLLAGHEGDIVNAANQQHVDPKLMAAIVATETGWGTSKALKSFNNPGGLMGGKTRANTDFRSYPTLQAGLGAMASNLKRNYIDQGLTTVQGIGRKYAPTNAANDPRHTNNTWATTVSNIMQNIGQ